MTVLPIRFDVFALVMLLGIAQGGLLSVFFLTGSRRNQPANAYLGWLMLGLSLLLTDLLLNYTNYMFRVVAINDSTEWVNLLLAPLFYAYVESRLRNRPMAHFGWHAVPAIGWAAYSLIWLTRSEAAQYNAYVNAYHPELPQVAAPITWRYGLLGLRDWINELTVLSLLVYNTLAWLALRRAFRQQGLRFWAAAPTPLPGLRFLVVLLLCLPGLVVLTKHLFPKDLGDYWIACYITLTIYCTTFWTLVGPSPEASTTDAIAAETEPEPVADEPPNRRKYEKSALSAEQETALLSRLEQLTATERTHLRADVSLSALARQLNTSSHHLSQVLNNRLGLSFFDWLAQHRVAEAQRLLTDPATARLKIDEIAERVGYNSPSAFHTAFKRLTNQTPAQFREALPGAKMPSDG